MITVHTNGFTLQHSMGISSVEWSAILQIDAYKVDLMTMDEICMEIFYADRVITITEETQGWNELVAKTKEIFPGIPEKWDTDIIRPAFATNYQILYKKQDSEANL